MTSLKYLLTGPNGKYLQANGEFDNPIETAMLFSSLEEITTYIVLKSLTLSAIMLLSG